jgi:KDO2-lipid IV(A) lauroyltransferase
MKFIVYIIVYTILWLTARLPLKIIYLVSDFFYLVVYYIIGYRKDIVFKNLALVFPAYSEKEIRTIAKRFYKHFTDVLIESALMPFFSYERSSKHLVYKNPELLERLYDDGRFIIGIGAHYGNWEYLIHIEKKFRYRFLAIYKPLKNKYFDRFVKRSRSRFGSITVEMKQVGRTLFGMKKDKMQVFCGFLTDQRPVLQHIRYWTKFLGLDTPVYLGPEKLAKKLEAAVVYISIRKLRRGMYEMEFDLIAENAAQVESHDITEAHIRLLEKLIREEPAYWLWSHNRWKFDYEEFKRNYPNWTQ